MMFSKSNSSTPTDQHPSINATQKNARTTPPGAPSIIGADVKITGNLETKGEIQLDGAVEGDIRSSALTLGENGHVNGSIHAESVVVKGTVNGQVSARSVRLEKTARIEGDLHHETVSVEAGARIHGHFINSKNAGREQPQKLENTMKVVANSEDSMESPEPRNAKA